VIRRDQEPGTSRGGIALLAEEKPYFGEVLEVGQGKTLKNGKVRPLSVKKGDRVVFGKFSGTEIEVNGEPVLVMSEDDVIGVIEK
jgi:chaperonin GroES